MWHFQLEKAYDKIMMAQLTKRKKGETFGSFKVVFFAEFFGTEISILHEHYCIVACYHVHV